MKGQTRCRRRRIKKYDHENGGELGYAGVGSSALRILRQPKASALGGHPSSPTHEFIRGFLCLRSRYKKKEAALPQHYLSPNQIKPNYIFRKSSSSLKNQRSYCKKYNYKFFNNSLFFLIDSAKIWPFFEKIKSFLEKGYFVSFANKAHFA